MTTIYKYPYAKIYRIDIGDDFYIGSTTHKHLSQRKAHHNASLKDGTIMMLYSKMREIGIDFSAVELKLVKKFPCHTKPELFNEEGKIQRQLKPSLNKLIAGTPTKERKREIAIKSKEKNKIKILRQQREHREKNKDKINQKNRDKTEARLFLYFVEHCDTPPEPRKKREVSDETRRKLSTSAQGRKVSEDTRRKLSKSNHQAEQLRELSISKQKKINQYTKDNVFIKLWSSLKDASITLKIDNGSISKVCKGKIKSAGGFIWKYAPP